MMAIAFTLSVRAPLDYTFADPWGNLLTAQALIEHRTVHLDAYAHCRAIADLGLASRIGDHLVYYFPVGTPMLAVPAVLVARPFGFDACRSSHNSRLQRLLAAASVALAIPLIYRLARRRLDRPISLVLTAVFGFGSSTISTLGTALWSLDTALLLHLLALLLLTGRERRGPWLGGGALGLVLFLAYLCRPTSAVFIALIWVFLAHRRPRWLGPSMITSGLLFLGFVAFSFAFYDSALPPYYWPTRLGSDQFWVAWIGNLVSPSRGVLVLCPYLAVVLLLLARWPRITLRDELVVLGLAWWALHSLSVASYYNWWGAATFGNRLFADAIPSALLVTVGVTKVARRELAPRAWASASSLFLLAAGGAIVLHSFQGLYNPSTARWGEDGTYVDHLFDWQHPQWLATPERLAEHGRRHVLPRLPDRPLTRPIGPNDRDLLFEGWSRSEGEWRWTDRAQASLRFRARDLDTTQGEWSLEIEADTMAEQEIPVFVQGAKVGMLVSLGRSGYVRYRFPVPGDLLGEPAPGLGPGQVEVAFLIPGARRPRSLNADDYDPRLLGLRMRSVRFLRPESKPGAPPAGSQPKGLPRAPLRRN